MEKLQLDSCGIGDDGAAVFAEALRSNTSLTYLNLNPGWQQLLSSANGITISEQGQQLLWDAVAGREGFELWPCRP